ncbi:MAG: antibiotic biosynthesis monooxygenase [Desulfobacterales bacterium]|nr:antibiotic biosynthesis monooxygenase [Desulfobacterales bacterium]
MAVKILITRSIPTDKARKIIPLFKELRANAAHQPGYISGETLKSSDRPDTFLVISTWQTAEDWGKWLLSKDRQAIQQKVDDLLGGNTEYEIFHYGFTE